MSGKMGRSGVKLTQKQFIEKVNLIHKNKYDYSKFIYLGSNIKGTIICPDHGEFLQRPSNHYRGGCKKCGHICTNNSKYLNNNEFIKRAKLIHGNFYDYSKVEYINTITKVIIICPIHYKFLQTPSNHISGSGCQICGENKKIGGWRKTDWNEMAKKSKKFDSFKFYIIECWNENEKFIKIGRTYTTLKYRFNHIKKYYKYRVILICKSNINYKKICDFETYFHNKNKEFKYTPKIKFGGYTECFSKIHIINNISINKSMLEKIIEYNKKRLTINNN